MKKERKIDFSKLPDAFNNVTGRIANFGIDLNIPQSITLSSLLLDRIVGDQKNKLKIPSYQPQMSTPNPQGTGSQALMKKGGTVSAEKAKEILRDGTVHGHPLTAKQKRYFGWIAGGKKQEGGDVEDNQDLFTSMLQSPTPDNEFDVADMIDPSYADRSPFEDILYQIQQEEQQQEEQQKQEEEEDYISSLEDELAQYENEDQQAAFGRDLDPGDKTKKVSGRASNASYVPPPFSDNIFKNEFYAKLFQYYYNHNNIKKLYEGNDHLRRNAANVLALSSIYQIPAEKIFPTAYYAWNKSSKNNDIPEKIVYEIETPKGRVYLTDYYDSEKFKGDNYYVDPLKNENAVKKVINTINNNTKQIIMKNIAQNP